MVLQWAKIPFGLFFLAVLIYLFSRPLVVVLSNVAYSSTMEMTDAEIYQSFPEPVSVIPYNHVSKHGIEKHPEAAALEKSCNNAIYQIWKDKFEEKKFYYLCKLEKGWGIIPVVLDAAGKLVWKTAFSPGDGQWPSVFRYLARNATRYTGQVH